MGGGGECDGARQSGRDKGLGDEEGEESVRQTDDGVKRQMNDEVISRERYGDVRKKRLKLIVALMGKKGCVNEIELK